MRNLMNLAKTFLKSDDGPTATEYAVMLALIILVALGAVAGIGESVNSVYTNMDSNLATTTGG